MPLKLATLDDLPDVRRMCLLFKEASPYHFLETSIDRVDQTVETMITGDKSRNIVILSQDSGETVGMVAGIANEFLFSDEKVAAELVWWVDPLFRGKHGKELHEAFEFWANKVGCSVITMALLEDKNAERISKLYERKGYAQTERAFMKRI